jgi:putative toxin-antitoxin system antitoxin component (TIGR02293 family)
VIRDDGMRQHIYSQTLDVASTAAPAVPVNVFVLLQFDLFLSELALGFADICSPCWHLETETVVGNNQHKFSSVLGRLKRYERDGATDASLPGGTQKPKDIRSSSRFRRATFGAILSVIMVNELSAVVEELGGEVIFGRRLSTPSDLQDAIREGFPQTVVEEVMRAAGISVKELASILDLSPRSLQRRRREGRLARFESDRLYRLARIVALAKQYLGEAEIATRWLKRPNRALGGKVPLEFIDTELGARAVENVLGRIAYGGVS